MTTSISVFTHTHTHTQKTHTQKTYKKKKAYIYIYIEIPLIITFLIIFPKPIRRSANSMLCAPLEWTSPNTTGVLNRESLEC